MDTWKVARIVFIVLFSLLLIVPVIGLAEEEVAPDPALAKTHNLLGISYLNESNFDDAMEQFQLAKQYDPEEASYSRNLASAYSRKGSGFFNEGLYEEALIQYQQAMEENPDEVIYQNNSANSLYRLERYDEAMAAVNRAIAMDSAYSRAYEVRGGIYYRLTLYEAALEDYRKAYELDPAGASYNNIAIALQKLDRHEEAAEFLQGILSDE